MISRWSLSLSDALHVIAAAQIRARELDIAVAVAVVDPAGTLIALQAMDGTQPAGPDVAVAKARASALFRRPSAAFEEAGLALGKPSILLLPSVLPHALPVMGGQPVLVPGSSEVAGAIGVSGGTGAQDDDVACCGLVDLESVPGSIS